MGRGRGGNVRGGGAGEWPTGSRVQQGREYASKAWRKPCKACKAGRGGPGRQRAWEGSDTWPWGMACIQLGECAWWWCVMY